MVQDELFTSAHSYDADQKRLKRVKLLLCLNRSAIHTACSAIRQRKYNHVRYSSNDKNENIIQLNNSLNKFLLYRKKFQSEHRQLCNKLQGRE